MPCKSPRPQQLSSNLIILGELISPQLRATQLAVLAAAVQLLHCLALPVLFLEGTLSSTYLSVERALPKPPAKSRRENAGSCACGEERGQTSRQGLCSRLTWNSSSQRREDRRSLPLGASRVPLQQAALLGKRKLRKSKAVALHERAHGTGKPSPGRVYAPDRAPGICRAAPSSPACRAQTVT